jgi:hypothetical protein
MSVHTGPCRVPPASLRGRQDVPAAAAPARDYCLHDLSGRPIGTIPAPAARPLVGSAAPTVYLRRPH